MRRLACLLAFTGIVAYGAPDEAVVARFLKYRGLVRLTSEQIDVAKSVQTMCRDPLQVHGPHIEPGIHLYVSPNVIEERKKNPDAHHFPRGAVLVKEKFESKGGDQPSLITVMEKVADEGKADDWQFNMIRLADRKIVRDGFKVSCVDCHSHYPESDFVSGVTDSLVSAFARTGAPSRPDDQTVFSGGLSGKTHRDFPQPRSRSISYAGGDGTAPEKAVIVQNASDEMAGIRAENAWLALHYPGARKTGQQLTSFAGKRQDEISITTSAGEEKKVYFDISGFFGKF